tara:strand:+ start:265 stop:477 length:213 start_codon:yes stop_codon:yes gene_type:complete
MGTTEISLHEQECEVEYEYIEGESGDYYTAPSSPSVRIFKIYGRFGEISQQGLTREEIINIEEQIFNKYE